MLRPKILEYYEHFPPPKSKFLGYYYITLNSTKEKYEIEFNIYLLISCLSEERIEK